MNILLIFIRISLFIVIMESLRLFIRRAFSASAPLGFALCIAIIALCFLVAAIVDGRLKLRRSRRD